LPNISPIPSFTSGGSGLNSPSRHSDDEQVAERSPSRVSRQRLSQKAGGEYLAVFLTANALKTMS
jgi:hypothetical protein